MTPEQLGAITGAGGLVLGLLRMLAPVIADKRNQAAFAEVSRACFIAASAATQVMLRSLDTARSEGSDGGADVTQAELHDIAKAGAAAGMAHLRQLGPATLSNVLRFYGGEEAVGAALVSFAHKAVSKRAGGA